MTDYVKSTNFASKDSLATGNPLKIVKGTEIDTEFNNIATAVATKADINSPAFIGTPTSPTASAGTNSTVVATTEFVQTAIAAVMQVLYPVGSIYINSINAANPSTLFGFGTWVSFGSGRVLAGYDITNSNFNAPEKVGGSQDAIVVSHTHTLTDPGHNHTTFIQTQIGGTSSGPDANWWRKDASTTGTSTTGISVNTTGSAGTNANLQPYITVYMWKRTA